MSEEMAFFMYLLENYAAYRNQKTGDTLQEWDQKGITHTIYDNYWSYHTETLETHIRISTTCWPLGNTLGDPSGQFLPSNPELCLCSSIGSIS